MTTAAAVAVLALPLAFVHPDTLSLWSDADEVRGVTIAVQPAEADAAATGSRDEAVLGDGDDTGTAGS
jgi:hypothetical protein